MDTPSTKLDSLKRALANMGGILVAYSGGVDSTFLLKVARDVLGDKVSAVTVKAPFVPASELVASQEIAHQLGVRHLLAQTALLDDPGFSSNPPNRCYVCKRAIFSRLKEIASAHGLDLADGSNHDDLGQYRPGLKALQELDVRSPLAEAGLTKTEIRSLSREMGLPTWDKPAQSCLATRFPYGEELTIEKLRRVEEAEDFLHSLGFRIVRVRTHGTLASIEVSRPDMARLLSELTPRIIDKLKSLGYTHVSLDLEGYRTGSMDEVMEG